jgi:hypothetical protein
MCADPQASHDRCRSAGGAGCPNIAYQVVSYMRQVNAAYLDALGSKADHAVLLRYLSSDGEDMGSMAGPGMYCQFRVAADDARLRHPDDDADLKIGYAKGLQAGPNAGGGNFAMPETYWYMNETWPCLADAGQDGNKPSAHAYPSVCTSLMSYRHFADRPQAFLEFLRRADACGDNGFAALVNNIRAHPDGIFPMFSFENLSGGKPELGKDDRTCLARHFLGAGNKFAKGNGCGTFDGFAYWSWPRFLEFMIRFAETYMVPHMPPDVDPMVGLYETQFIPPQWMDSGAFDVSAAACDTACGGGGGSTGGGGSSPPATKDPCDGRTAADAACDAGVYYAAGSDKYPGPRMCAAAGGSACGTGGSSYCRTGSKLQPVYQSPTTQAGGPVAGAEGHVLCCHSCHE